MLKGEHLNGFHCVEMQEHLEVRYGIEAKPHRAARGYVIGGPLFPSSLPYAGQSVARRVSS